MFFEFDDFDVRDRFFTIEEKTQRLKLILEAMGLQRRHAFGDMCLRAYIYHDSALDGVVVTSEEIASVFHVDSNALYVRSRVLQEIKNHRDLVRLVQEQQHKERKKDEMQRCDVIRMEQVVVFHEKLYQNIARREAGKLRKVTPLHSAYFHVLIDPKLVEKQLLELCRYTENREFQAQHPINQAVLFHQQFMHVFPFLEGSGKVGRLFMNSFLVQGGYDLAIIHSSERQRYYETLRDGPEPFRDLLLDSMESALDAQIKLLSDEDFARGHTRLAMRRMEAG